MARPNVRIYACGGTGINIVYPLQDLQRDDFLAEPLVTYIDCGLSDTRDKSIDPCNFYQIHGVDDGSGKRRDTNYEYIKRAVPDIVDKHKPEDLNLIICSGGGGTGSVVMSELVRELHEMGKAYIIFLVGSHESKTTTSNNIKTWNTLNSLRNNIGANPVICYESNGARSLSKAVDESVFNSIISVLDLYSDRHERLDNRDVTNFIRITDTLKTNPEVLLLDIFTNRDEAGLIETPLGIASIINENDIEKFENLPADYNCEGLRVNRNHTLYFVIHNNEIEDILNQLYERDDEFSRILQSRAKRQSGIFGRREGDLNDDGVDL